MRTYLIGHLNVCGWTKSNHDLRSNLIKHVNCDIVSLNETHLSDDNGIVLTELGYKWKGFNRKNLHINAPKGSGGVGLLIKNCIFETYEVTVVDQSYDGILGVTFKNKQSGFELVVFTCYLPPENSPWGRDASRFYTRLLTQIY